MTERLDLLKIAQEEQSGDLFKLLDQYLQAIRDQAAGHFPTRSSGKAEPARQREAGRARVHRHVRRSTAR